MPELPDVIAYCESLHTRIVGRALQRIQILSPFLLRTFEPPAETLVGRTVEHIGRIGKRIILHFDDDLHAVIHPMIAGRLRWERPGARPTPKIGLAALGFENGTLVLTEASQKKRAALHVVRGRGALHEFDAGGIDVIACSVTEFAERLQRENHTVKRSLTDPRLFDGIGNAYSDEILHAARLSPIVLTQKLGDEEVGRLHDAARATLLHWIGVLREQFKDHFPRAGEITAFRDGFAVHGRFGAACGVCGSAVQRIRYADNETNYCPACQTGGRILADRSLSRLLKDDWPRSLGEL